MGVNLLEIKKTAVAYLRVSTEMQVDGYSLDAQLTNIKKYANAYDIDIINTYEDKGKSGKSVKSRPNFSLMLEDIASSKISVDYVLVYKLSRFGRNAADVLTSVQKLQKHKTNLICTDDAMSSATGSGKFMITVLSSVAEIERVNILEQTMSGRRQKALDGKWNGGFAPYGYKLENGSLEIEPTEVKVIELIFSKYINSDMGYNGIAKYLNQQGIEKRPRKNGKLTRWSQKFIKDVLDNPVYSGQIAYGRRTKELKEGTEDEYHTVLQDTEKCILSEGIHKEIISSEDWKKVRAKRSETGVRSPSTVGRDRVHLFAGILRYPECGSPMYTNKNNAKRKGCAVTEVFYYVCSRNKSERGVSCSYSTSYRKDDIEPLIISEIRNLARNEKFAEDIKSKIGKEVDTAEIDKELKEYKKSLKLCETAKNSLGEEIDTMPLDEPHRERKRQDKIKRLNKLYDEIYDLEEKIDDLIKKRRAVETNALNLEQVYQIILSFDKLYGKMSDTEQKKMVSYLIDTVEVYKKAKPRDRSKLRSITFNFPVSYGGETGNKILWDNEPHVETVVKLVRK